MASTKRSALAPGFTVDTTALHQYNTTNFVEYASFEQQASSFKQQASSPKLFKQRAASSKPRAASFKQQAASIELQDIFSFIKFPVSRSERLYWQKN
jgi:hypothetical protein